MVKERYTLVCIFYVQVFLDEINTSSCLGLFKEIIQDHTFDGEVLWVYNRVCFIGALVQLLVLVKLTDFDVMVTLYQLNSESYG